MTEGPQRAFRSVALQRAASPEQLDYLVKITKPSDWILASVVCLARALEPLVRRYQPAVLLAPGGSPLAGARLGRRPTRLSSVTLP